MKSFFSSLSHFHHFLLLPVKAAAFPSFVCLCPLLLRYTYLSHPWTGHPRHPQDQFAQFIRQEMLAGVKECLYDRETGNVPFWHLHWFPIWALFCSVLAVGNEIATVISLLNTTFFVCATLGLPLVTTLPPLLCDILVGLVTPMVAVFQIAMFFLPMLPFSWWFTPSFAKYLHGAVLTVICTLGSWMQPVASFGASLLLTMVLPMLNAGKASFGPYMDWIVWPAVEWLGMDTLAKTGIALALQEGRVVDAAGSLAASGVAMLHGLRPFEALVILPVQFVKVERLHHLCLMLLSPFEAAFSAQVWLMTGLLPSIASSTHCNNSMHFMPGLLWSGFQWLGGWLTYLLTSRVLLQVAWAAVMLRGWWLSSVVLSEVFDQRFNPLALWITHPAAVIRWVLHTVLSILSKLQRAVRRLALLPLQIYDGVLVRWTRLCHSLGLPGEGLLVMLSLVWIFWPCYVPLKSGQWTFFYSAGPWSLLNMQRARSIVARAWRPYDI